jgi:hypothetical protein
MEPHLLRVDGIIVRKQLVGGHALEHELGTVLLRRWAQIDRESNTECPYITYKHVLELDFLVSSSLWSPTPKSPFQQLHLFGIESI